MPKRTRSHQLEDLSVSSLSARFQQSGWVVYRLAPDYGEDLLVRVFRLGEPTPHVFFVQAKATDDISRYYSPKREQFRYPLKTSHIRHWSALSEPVLVTLWDSSSDKTYWEFVHTFCESEEGIASLGKTGATVNFPIPADNVLDDEGIRVIRHHLTQRIGSSDRVLEIIERLSDLLKKEVGVTLEFDPNDSESMWVHLPSGDCVLMAFGGFAELLVRFEEVSGRPLISIIEESLNRDEQKLEELKKGRAYEETDAHGNVTAVYQTLKELQDANRRRARSGETAAAVRRRLGLPVDD